MNDWAGRDVAAIIAAGGSGTRMAEATGGVRKQFVQLGDAPVFVQSTRPFIEHRAIGPVVLVMPLEVVADAEAAIVAYGLAQRVEVVAGGATRQSSVAQGLATLSDQVDFVLVHDAVRPFVSTRQIDAVIAALRRSGAAAPTVPVADTLRRADGSVVGAWVDREGLQRMQTPQGARVDWLKTAHLKSAGRQSTDEVGALQGAGYEVQIVGGDEWNRKLTRPEDLDLARALWPVWLERESSGL